MCSTNQQLRMNQQGYSIRTHTHTLQIIIHISMLSCTETVHLFYIIMCIIGCLFFLIVPQKNVSASALFKRTVLMFCPFIIVQDMTNRGIFDS